MSQHNLYAVDLNGTVVGGVGSQSIDIGSDVRNESRSGFPYNEIAVLGAQRPRATFTTRSVAEAFNAIPLTGLYTGGGGTLVLFGQKREQGGTRSAGSVHRSYTLNEAAAILRQVTADHQGDASLDLEVLIGSDDGVNEPFVVSDVASLPTLPTANQIFTLGPTTIAGITFTGKRSLAIDFGIQETVEGADSDLWPTELSLQTILPTITLRGIDLSWWGATAVDKLVGKEATFANTEFFFRRRKTDGGFYADTDTEHIKFNAQGLVTVARGFDATGADPAETELTVTTHHDGTNLPVTITTGVAISGP